MVSWHTKKWDSKSTDYSTSSHELKLIIVRDMFLTGFDAPTLHTMYLDKPIKGHTLMQAIARVNRVYPGKEGGLIVDYMGVGAELKEALMDYTESGGNGKPTFDQDQAVMLMQEKYEIVKDMFHGFNYRRFLELQPSERVSFVPQVNALIPVEISVDLPVELRLDR